MVKPRRLKPGDTISVIAPAGPVDPSEILPGMEKLKSMGYEILPGPHVYEKKEYLAGDDHARIEDLHSAFDNRDVKAIFCARGGYGTLRLLPGIRFESVRENPKILVGYSDITSLLLAVHKETGLVTFHGPTVREYSKNDGNNLTALIRLLSSEEPSACTLKEGSVLREGRAEGRLIGGNLSMICHLAGTMHMPDFRGAILFLEDRGEPLYRMDRMLTHLGLCGVLNGIGGIVAGNFEDCGGRSRVDDLIMDAVGTLQIPVVSGFPIGHGEVNLALPIGLGAILDTKAQTLSFPPPCRG